MLARALRLLHAPLAAPEGVPGVFTSVSDELCDKEVRACMQISRCDIAAFYTLALLAGRDSGTRNARFADARAAGRLGLQAGSMKLARAVLRNAGFSSPSADPRQSRQLHLKLATCYTSDNEAFDVGCRCSGLADRQLEAGLGCAAHHSLPSPQAAPRQGILRSQTVYLPDNQTSKHSMCCRCSGLAGRQHEAGLGRAAQYGLPLLP